MNVGLYVGSRHDIIPLLLFPRIRRWIYMDALPEYEAGFEEDEYGKQKDHMYFQDCEKEMTKAGYDLNKQNPKQRLLLFKKGDREVYFFHSTTFPNVTPYQRSLLRDVSFLFLKAFVPHKSVLSMVCPTKPFTLLIWHAPLYYNYVKQDNVVDFENGDELTTFLQYNFVESVKYVWVQDKNIDNERALAYQIRSGRKKFDLSQIKQIKCTNLLDYAQKEMKSENFLYYKTIKDIPKAKLNRTQRQRRNKSLA